MSGIALFTDRASVVDACYNARLVVHVYKRSQQPIQPWQMIRRAGTNNIAPEVKAKYLILWNAEVVRRNGLWHYILEFDARDSLDITDPTTTHTNGKTSPPTYRDGIDWRAWLGQDWELVEPARREQILTQDQPAGPGGVVISNLKLGNRPPRPE
jgi:hypothetical protein